MVCLGTVAWGQDFTGTYSNDALKVELTQSKDGSAYTDSITIEMRAALYPAASYHCFFRSSSGVGYGQWRVLC